MKYISVTIRTNDQVLLGKAPFLASHPIVVKNQISYSPPVQPAAKSTAIFNFELSQFSAKCPQHCHREKKNLLGLLPQC
jgi:hypothetical protein